VALPVIFEPVVINKRVLVDGGTVNPVPYDLLEGCDVVIAVNVMGNRRESNDFIPAYSEAVFNTFQIMQTSILKQKLIDKPPDIYIAPEIVDIKMLEFYKADQIFKQTIPAKDLLRRKIEKIIGN
jgi:NTE family protein